MNFDYQVEWTEKAEQLLLKNIQFIFFRSRSAYIAEKFYKEVKYLTQKKLILMAATITDSDIHIHPIKNDHLVKYVVDTELKKVYVIEFVPAGKNYN